MTTDSQKSQTFDLAISLILHAWPALTVAVQNSWGGPASSSKRDWFAGAVSDYFASSAADLPAPDASGQVASAALQDLCEDVECLLLQVMEDEFDVRLEDETEVEVARQIVQAWGQCQRGEFGGVEEMARMWREREERRGRNGATGDVPVTVREVEEEGEWSEGDEDADEDEDGDVGMDDEPPPRLVPLKEKPAPEVDEEGFTKVVGKKKR